MNRGRKDNSNNSEQVQKNQDNYRDGKKSKRNKRKKGYSDNGLMTSLSGPNIITDGSKDNDASWYMHLDAISRDYASLPFNQVVGLINSNVTRSFGPGYTSGSAFITSPGLMTINFVPTIGSTANNNSAPINVAAQQLYTLVRRANSGRVNYDKTDLMMLIMAMDSAYILYEDLLRAFRVMSTYSNFNRYYPNMILNALGFDSSLQENLNDFRGLLDLFAYKLASVNIPDQLDIIKRHSWMCSNIYLDRDDNKAQSYAFVPQLVYRWTEGVGSTPTNLTPTTLHPADGSTKYTIDDIASLINNIMNPILGSEDVGIITGDLLKAFGESGMIKIRPVEDYAALAPVYSTEVLLQITNTFASIGDISFTGSYDGKIKPVLTDTVSGPYLTQSLAALPKTDGIRRLSTKPVLNFPIKETSPENVLVATRLISLCSSVTSGGAAPLYSYGTEICTGGRIWYNTLVGTTAYTSLAWDQDIAIGTGTTRDTIDSNLKRIMFNSNFDWSPTQYLYSITGSSLDEYIGPIMDINNYVILDDTTIVNLHEVATMSLFTVKDYKLSF